MPTIESSVSVLLQSKEQDATGISALTFNLRAIAAILLKNSEPACDVGMSASRGGFVDGHFPGDVLSRVALVVRTYPVRT